MGFQNKDKNFYGERGGGNMRHLPVESGETFPLCGGQVNPLPLPVCELPPHQAEKVLQVLNPPGKQCSGSGLVSMRIRLQQFRSMRIRIQEFDDQMRTDPADKNQWGSGSTTLLDKIAYTGFYSI
jgi:hypothetical protein